MNLKSGGIYCIVNLLNHKSYVGSAVNLNKRFNAHLHQLRNLKHTNSHLQAAWNKYGEDAFEFRVIADDVDCSNLIKYEQAWIDFTRPEYNIAPVAGSTLGVKRSAETIEKRRATIAARTHCKHGHELTPGNTYHWKNNRYCMTCRESNHTKRRSGKQNMGRFQPGHTPHNKNKVGL